MDNFEDIDEKIKDSKQKNEESTQTKQVVKLVSESGANLFHDQFNTAYLAPYGDGKLVFKLKSKSARIWLSQLYWKNTKTTLSPNTLQSILQVLEANACFDGPEITLSVRNAQDNDVIWIDLGSKAIQVTASGWDIIENPPILFKRFPHQKAQVEPKRGGDPKELLNFLNLKSESETRKLSSDQLLIICWTVFGFIPGLPHPVPILNGGQGSKKTTFLKVHKALLDPSSVEVQRAPGSEVEFIQTASHHLFLVLDNVTSLPEWLSDAICSIITGAGYSKRELYSDDDDIIYAFKHLIGINGINLVVEKADLLERSIILSLKRIKKFKTEKVFWTEFEASKPYILGGLLDVLAKTLQIIETMPEPEGEFRMADFAHWGSAISQALGYTAQDFIEAYQENIGHQNEEALDASPVGTAVIHFMSDQNRWSGSPTGLLSELEGIADELKIDKKSKSWPKDPRWLWRRINEVLPNLEAAGIKAERDKDDQRLIILEKLPKNDVNDDSNEDSPTASQAQTDNTDIKDNISPDLNNQVSTQTELSYAEEADES